ncbi:PLD nuclease N-terminal domain-containing protein [Actinocorallia sp. A-T 12471]|uniref:PLD nuclease N-terminal domain-containing protein n=1 Tax=Actinocorallia sp. A-T 12471 TaxID=3089813 RepID=UPI0029CEEA38|nr:PLD nuclease N-terminal domain-containing protein [Actinocorallia sp. A-T 12471]MDX6739283.1 PLD nuclease N-terminal domain-containing protein [Actinocorallia sp. A-T 12471]
MLLLFGGFGLILLAFWIFCIFDVLTTDAQETRNLPKLFWFVIVVLLPDVGSILWVLFGRPRPPWEGLRRRPVPVKSAPDDDEEFLRGLQARVEEQRRRAREQQQGDEP